MATEQFTNNATTTLSGGIDNVTTSIPIVSATGFPTLAQYRIRIDNELMLVTAGAGTGTWTATRGVEGTTAASHLSGATVKHVLTASALIKSIADRLPQRYFYVSQYTPFNDLVNSDTAAIQAAINACVAQGGGVVVLDAVDWYLNATGGVIGLTHPADFAGQLTIQGLGMTVTSVRLGPRNKTFMTGDTSYSDNTHTYKNLTMQDFTVNARNLNGTDNGNVGSTPYGVVYASQGRCNYENLQFRRIRTVNMGPNMALGQACTDGISSAAVTREKRNIDITISTTPEGALSPNQYTIKNIIVEDCQFGYSGGGGNVGVVITAFHGDATSSQRYANYMYNTPYLSNTQIQNVRISRCSHDPGSPATSSTSVAATSGAFAGINFMIGQAAQGYNWLIEDCYGANSVDVGIEVDSGLNTVVRNCYMVDAYDANFYHSNIGGGSDTYGLSNPNEHTKFINCRALHTMAIDTGALQPAEAFTVAQPKFATPFGHVTLEDCEAIRTPNGTWNSQGGQLVEFRGNFRSINIKNLHTSETYSTSDTTAHADTAVSIAAMGGRTQVNIDGIHDELVGTPTGVTSNIFTRNVLALVNGCDLQLDIRGITYRHQWRATNGHKLTSNAIKMTASTDFADAFGSGTQSINRDYLLDAGGGVTGAVTDVSQTATINSILNPTTEQRFIYVMASGNGSWVNTGPFTDQSFSIKSTPGPTINGHKTGIILKRRSEDPTTYLECSVSDNGTSSFLKIDKILAGVRTNLATSAALGTRISNATAYWVRGYIQGNLITADYFTSAPGAITTSGATTLTFTLLTTDIEKLGDVRQGWGGFSWIANDAAATLDDLTFKRLGVYGGRGFTGIQPLEVSGPANVAYGFTNGLGAGTWRIRGQIKFRECDFTQLKNNTNVAEFRYADGDTALQAKVDAQGITYVTYPAAATVTPPATGVAYTNTSGVRERHFISGGTISALTLTDANGTATTVPTVFSGTLNPGESLTPTYTVAPTIWTKVPLP